MDIKTNKMIGSVFLGNNVNPHMVMMSPDGRYVVTGGTRANKAYIIDTRTLQLVKVIPVDIAPEHLAFSPDSRWYYQGNPDGDSISVIDMQSLSKIKTIPGFVEPLNITFTAGRLEGVHRELRRALGRRGRRTAPRADQEDSGRRDARHSRSSIPPSTSARSKGSTSRAHPGRAISLRRRQRLGVVGVIDTREDKVIKMIRVGQGPVAHLHEPRRQVRHHGQQRRRARFRSSTPKSNSVAATLRPARP